eukprot:evm.model.scf_2009.1 EVM.evm.TU.scf_2009.1   scf_2009:9898-23560(-)
MGDGWTRTSGGAAGKRRTLLPRRDAMGVQGPKARKKKILEAVALGEVREVTQGHSISRSNNRVYSETLLAHEHKGLKRKSDICLSTECSSKKRRLEGSPLVGACKSITAAVSNVAIAVLNCCSGGTKGSGTSPSHVFVGRKTESGKGGTAGVIQEDVGGGVAEDPLERFIRQRHIRDREGRNGGGLFGSQKEREESGNVLEDSHVHRERSSDEGPRHRSKEPGSANTYWKRMMASIPRFSRSTQDGCPNDTSDVHGSLASKSASTGCHPVFDWRHKEGKCAKPVSKLRAASSLWKYKAGMDSSMRFYANRNWQDTQKQASHDRVDLTLSDDDDNRERETATNGKTGQRTIRDAAHWSPWRGTSHHYTRSNRLKASCMGDLQDVKALYPPEGGFGAVDIGMEDLERLEPLEFLNDTIIDYYTKRLYNCLPPSEKSRFHVFNSFFYKQLAEAAGTLFEANKKCPGYERVKNWTKVDLFSKDYLFVPIHEALHWSLAVVCHPSAAFAPPEDDAEEGREKRTPCILHLDSLRGGHCSSAVCARVRKYLECHWLKKHPGSGNPLVEFRIKRVDVPQQDNHCDCGLFLLMYTEYFMHAAPRAINVDRLDQLQREHTFKYFLSSRWFKRSNMDPFRLEIKKSILVIMIDRCLREGRTEAAEMLRHMMEDSERRASGVFKTIEAVQEINHAQFKNATKCKEKSELGASRPSFNGTGDADVIPATGFYGTVDADVMPVAGFYERKEVAVVDGSVKLDGCPGDDLMPGSTPSAPSEDVQR